MCVIKMCIFQTRKRIAVNFSKTLFHLYVSSVQLARGLAPGGTTPDELQSSQSWTVSTFQRGSQDPVSGEMQQSWPRAS